MSRRFLIVNVVLGIVSVAFSVGIARTLLVRRPVPGPAAPRAAPAPPAAAEPADAGPTSYAVIPARNLFNPGRSEMATGPAVAVAKPILHGVVITGAKSRAFLEDPAVKRVVGYSVGDTVGGGRIQKIADDRVVIARPEGSIEVLLQDPSKPRAAPTVTAAPGQPAPPAPNTPPGQFTQPQPGVPPGQLAQPQPGAPPNQAPTVPPSLRRRPPAPSQGEGSRD